MTTSAIKIMRLPQELLHDITGNGDVDSITFSAKKAGVTLSIATGAGPIAVAATGDAVAITGVIVGVSTLTNLQTAIAASAAVDALIGVTGVGATIFRATYAGLATTKLYADYAVDLHGMCGRRDDGKMVPLRLTDDGQIRVAVDIGDTIITNPYLPATPGATPTKQQGTTGILPQSYTYAIAAGKTILFQPLQHGVSVVVATAAAEAVAAVGKIVTFTDLNTDASTVTTMRATLAASNAAGLVRIDLGTAVVGDTWNHLLTLAETALWAVGTLPATCLTAWDTVLGRFAPVEMDATGGIKMSMSSLLFSEDGSRSTMRTEQQGTSSGWLAASTAVVAAGTAGRAYNVTFQVTGGAGATMKLRDDGAIGGAIRRQWVFAADGYYYYPLGDMPYGNGLYMEKNAGTCSFDVNYRNG